MTNICSEKLPESRYFYTTLFYFNVNYDSNWFIHLVSKDMQLELEIIDSKNDMIPKEFQSKPKGFYITFVVENTDEVHEIAKAEQFKIINKPSDMPYGQRRLLLEDPNGILVDVSSPIKGFNS